MMLRKVAAILLVLLTVGCLIGSTAGREVVRCADGTSCDAAKAVRPCCQSMPCQARGGKRCVASFVPAADRSADFLPVHYAADLSLVAGVLQVNQGTEPRFEAAPGDVERPRPQVLPKHCRSPRSPPVFT